MLHLFSSLKSFRRNISALLGRYPGRTIQRIGVALAGIWLAGTSINFFWPEPDQVASENSRKNHVSFEMGTLLSDPITILFVIVDSKAFGDKHSQSEVNLENNIHSLFLLRVSAKKTIDIIQIPIELAVQLPGQNGMTPLAEMYNFGGVALMADVVSEVIGLPEKQPHRFVEISSNAISPLVDELGGIRALLNDSISRDNDSRESSTILPVRAKYLTGFQVEKMILSREGIIDQTARRQREKLVLSGIAKKLLHPSMINKLPGILQSFSHQVRTNINLNEINKIGSTALSSRRLTVFYAIPLEPPVSNSILRYLKKDSPLISR